jgi:FkbM family methyltransferase
MDALDALSRSVQFVAHAPVDPLSNLLRPERVTTVVDIGANPIDGDPPYKSMLQKRLCHVVGFEPQPEALASLNARRTECEMYLPYVVGDGNSARLHVCRAPGMTSLLRPDQHMLMHFRGFTEWCEVIQEIAVSTHRLDDIAELEALDFLKIDVQGSELSVFRHGRERLRGAVAIQTEVSFLPLYEGQPVFGEIDLELRQQGFVPHTFPAINKRMIEPIRTDNVYAALNQLFEADIVYVRDFTRAEKMSIEQLKHLALVAHHCYGSWDLTANCIGHLIARRACSADSISQYLALMRQW